MTSNINQFLADTNKEIEKMQKKQVATAKQIVLTAYNAITEASPVDTSLFKHNHFITVNSTTNKTTETVDASVIGESKSEISNLKFKNNDSIYIQNNLSYADALEAGHSSQASAGVYGVTERKIEKLIARTKE